MKLIVETRRYSLQFANHADTAHLLECHAILSAFYGTRRPGGTSLRSTDGFFPDRDRKGCAAVLDWLIGNCELFGLPGQNWMLVSGGGLLLYIATLVIARHFQPHAH